jgi:U3 small nucleolar RNA-associated protein 22
MEDDDLDISDISGASDGESDSGSEDESVSSQRSNNDKFRPPSSEELAELREAQLFQTNLFRMQVNEMLSEVKVDYSTVPNTTQALHELKTAIDTLVEKEVCMPENLTKATKLKWVFSSF